MTLVEFLAPLAGNPQRDKCLAVLYYKQRYEQLEAMTVEQIRSALGNARVSKSKKINVADVLSKSGHYVDTAGVRQGKRLWKLTGSGVRHVRQLLDLPASEPEIEHDVASLSTLAARVSDTVVRGYIEEAVKCLSVGALRASIVFLWSGAIRTVEERMIAKGKNRLRAALTKHDPKARQVSKVEHFQYVKDKTTLLAAQELGIFDKGERSTLEDALNLRNRCGHPTKYGPGPKKASSFIEDVVNVVFS